jgi:Domain of unknown function (DUF4845)
MTHQALHKQKGLSFLSLIFWVALLGSILLVGMKTVPIVNEYLAIKKAVGTAASAGDEPAIRASFDKQSQVNYVDNFPSSLLKIEAVNGVTTVAFEYQRVVPLAGPVSLLFDFSGKALAR